MQCATNINSSSGMAKISVINARWMWVIVGFFICIMPLQAQEEGPRQLYYPFEPDITTNFIKLMDSRHLGYIRVSMEAIVDNPEDLGFVEHHAPLLRDAFIEIFGQAQEGKVRSLTGRQELRQECIEKARELLERETGRGRIRDLIFTTYLYQ